MEHIARYERNRTTISPEEQLVLAEKRVCICGCGGIGGYVVEMLARAGVGTIVAIDGDSFEESNLNRQLLSTEANMGAQKAQAAVQRVQSINSRIHAIAVPKRITEENATQLLAGAHLVVDALDSSATRLALEQWCAEAGIPLVHGAIAGWCAQITTVAPGSNVLESIYPAGTTTGDEARAGNPSFTPAVAAAIECAECIKVLLGKGEPLYGKLLTLDLQRNTTRVINL